MSQHSNNKPDKPENYVESFERQRRSVEQHLKVFMEKTYHIIKQQEQIAQHEAEHKKVFSDIVGEQGSTIADLRKRIAELEEGQKARDDEIAILRYDLDIVRAERDHLESILGERLDESEELTPRRKEPRLGPDRCEADNPDASCMSTDLPAESANETIDTE